jgi:hypothetical protein
MRMERFTLCIDSDKLCRQGDTNSRSVNSAGVGFKTFWELFYNSKLQNMGPRTIVRIIHFRTGTFLQILRILLIEMRTECYAQFWFSAQIKAIMHLCVTSIEIQAKRRKNLPRIASHKSRKASNTLAWEDQNFPL